MDLETWTTALAAVVSVLAIIGFSARSSRRLEVQITELARTVDQHRESGRADLIAAIGGLRTELRSDTADLRSELKSDVAELRSELRSDITELRGELKSDITNLRSELKSDIAELRSELKSDTAELRGEMRDGLGRIDARLTVIEQRTYDLSTRLPPAPAAPRP